MDDGATRKGGTGVPPEVRSVGERKQAHTPISVIAWEFDTSIAVQRAVAFADAETLA